MDFGIPYFQANASIVIESRNYAWLMTIGYAAQYIGDCSENPFLGPHEATIRRNFLMAIDTAHMDPAGVRHQIEQYVPFKAPDFLGFVAFCHDARLTTPPPGMCSDSTDGLGLGQKPGKNHQNGWAFKGKLMINHQWIFGNPIFQQIHVDENSRCHWDLAHWVLQKYSFFSKPKHDAYISCQEAVPQILLMWSLTYTWCLLCVPRIYGHVWKWNTPIAWHLIGNIVINPWI